jgi:hypothetical protein
MPPAGEFQSQVNVAQAPAVLGDFASKNPRYTYDAGPGGCVAGPNGCLVGHFAWATFPDDADGTPATVSSSGFGPPTGFIHREQQGLIINYLASSGLTIQKGFGVTIHIGGDFWVLNAGATEALNGQKAYANFADGSVTFAAAGAPATAASGSASTVAAGTSSVTGSVADDLMTVTAIGSGTLYAGTTVSGTGIATGAQIVSQVTPLIAGEALGGIGRYLLNIGEMTTASETISGTYGLLTIGGTVVAGFAVGQVIAGSGVVAGTSIRALGTGAGGAGTYIVDNNTVVGSTAINSTSNVETKWFARSTGLPGELVKISEKPLG